MENKELWEILVPRNSNQGVEYDLDYHHKWDDQVRALAGGITILRTVKGQWTNPDGTFFAEPMIPVRVLSTREAISSIVDLTLEHYDQEAVLAYRISSEVILRHRIK